MKKIIIFLFFFLITMGKSFSSSGMVDELITEKGYKIIHKDVDQSSQFHFILEHKKRRDIVICTTAMNYSGQTETVCGRP